MRLLPIWLVLAGAACAQDIAPPPVRNLDRPTAMSYACFGDLRLNGGDPSKTTAPVKRRAQPLASCQAQADGTPPPGQEGVVAPALFGFVLQSSRGTVAVVDMSVAAVIDSDPLTPGKNAIPVGTLPVAMATDESSCFLVTANAGSCDLSGLEITSALETGTGAVETRIPVTAGGQPLLARPRTMVARPERGVIGLDCPATPQGMAYVAYPACHLVAAVDLATGAVKAGIQFHDDGSAAITDGNVTCPSECGSASATADVFAGLAAGPIDAGTAADAGPLPAGGAPRPAVVSVGSDGKLYVGAENSPKLTIVTLDGTGLPTALATVALEGDVGIDQITVSDVIAMGGSNAKIGGTAGDFRFAYVVADDQTVRVVDVGHGVECDTQVDPRYLHDVTDVTRLSCLPVGDPLTPPRRAGARSPGIQLPHDIEPLDVGIVQIAPADAPTGVAPNNMVGTFAFIAGSDGLLYIANIDDDVYPDVEVPTDPIKVFMPLAMAHQLRDSVFQRDGLASGCGFAPNDSQQLGPRQADPFTLSVSPDRVASDKVFELPSVHQIGCAGDSGLVPLSELSFSAAPEVREQAFPDLFGVKNENWFLTWEGLLSIDGGSSAIDGPSIRGGVIRTVGGRVELEDHGRSLCQTGVEPYDIVNLVGCDPAVGNNQCGVGETCYVHPDSPTAVSNGMCLPTDQLDTLSSTCREFLIGKRTYTVKTTVDDHLILAERRRVLRTEPLDGCTGDDQCRSLAHLEHDLADPKQPIDLMPGTPVFDWVCRSDNSHKPGPAHCLMACTASSECEAGFLCKDGTCVEGVLPPPKCVQGIERYQLRVGEAFALMGDRSGFLHGRVADPTTGECVTDPKADPLLVGRVPLRAPPCSGDGVTDLSPNPCATTVKQTESFDPFELVGTACRPKAATVRTRDAAAIRVANPAMNLNLVDPETHGDLACRGDGAGTAPSYATVFPGYQIQIPLVGGFVPMFVPGVEAAFPRRVVLGPDHRLWVLDQGDASSATTGRLFVVDPRDAANGFTVLLAL